MPFFDILSPIQPVNFYVSTRFIEYDDTSYDETLREKVVERIRESFLTKWLTEHYSDLFGYFVVRSGKVELIPSPIDKNYKSDNYKKDSDSDLKLIAKLIADELVTERFVRKVLEKYGDDTGTKWYNFYKYNHEIRQYLHKCLVKRISRAIEKK